MNLLEKTTAIGAIGLSSLIGCGDTISEPEEDNSYVVTEASLPWHKTDITHLRQSREGDSACIDDEVFQNMVSVGDKVRLLVKKTDECLFAADVDSVSKESHRLAGVVCEVESSVHQLEYLDYVYGIAREDLVGFSWTGEDDNNVWWEFEGNVEDTVDPKVIGNREDPEYGILHTYQYQFRIPSNLIPFVFENPVRLFSDTFIAANYWPSNNLAVYFGFNNCRVE